MCFKVCMSADEKKVAVLPESVRARDRGGLFIPKLCFLPFISIVIETVCQYANREAYKKYGRNLLKVCSTEVRSVVQIHSRFTKACATANVDESEDVLLDFFHVWTRKLVHARLNEFISANNSFEAKAKGRSYIKGGHTLRDTLYSLTTAGSERRKAQKRKLTGTIENTKAKKPRCTAKSSDRIVESQQPSCSTKGIIKRKKLKPRRLLDFICEKVKK